MSSPSAVQRTIQRQTPNVLPPLASQQTPPPSSSDPHDEETKSAADQSTEACSPAQVEESCEDDDDFLDWETRKEAIPIGKHIIAGSCAGIMEHVGCFPMDTIKTHMQASGRTLGMRSIASILYKDEGLLRFWHGAQVMASGCVPAHASYFLMYEHLKLYLNFDNDSLNFRSTLTIGGLTTFAHDFFITPADVMKQRMQLCKNLTAVQCFKNIMREEGLRGLYRSYPLTVSMNIPFASCVVCCNENLKTILRPWERDHPLPWYFLCAGTAGGLAGFLTNPLDVIKTRLQTQEVQPSCKRLRKMWENEKQEKLKQEANCCEQSKKMAGHHTADCSFKVHPSRYIDFKSTVSYIWRTEGPRAFTKGVLPRMCQNVPSTALSWGTYELIKSFLIGSKDGED